MLFMPPPFTKVPYASLNGRQKENYNYHKISAILADYGITTLRLTDDWCGADFIAVRISGEHLLVQQKSRLSFAEKYRGRNLYIAFPRPEGGCYFYPHDELLQKVAAQTGILTSESWKIHGAYNFPWSWMNSDIKAMLEEFKIEPVTSAPEPGDQDVE
jgi:hypothetical protein